MKFAVLAFALALPQLAHAEPISIDSIIALTEAGIGDDAIVAKINASESRFNISTDEMISLKKRGISGPVLAAMLTAGAPKAGVAPQMSLDSPDPMTAHAAGVYLLSDWDGAAKMKRIDATVSNQAKTGGILGYALTSGIASMSIKASIQNETARTQARASKPVFFFFFDESNPNINQQSGTWLSGTAATTTSPNEFTLVRLTAKSGRREARVGSMNIGGAKTGVMDKDRIQFDYELVRPGVYKASPTADLLPGEYGFIHSMTGGGTAGAMTARIFDFSVAK